MLPQKRKRTTTTNTIAKTVTVQNKQTKIKNYTHLHRIQLLWKKILYTDETI